MDCPFQVATQCGDVKLKELESPSKARTARQHDPPSRDDRDRASHAEPDVHLPGSQARCRTDGSHRRLRSSTGGHGGGRAIGPFQSPRSGSASPVRSDVDARKRRRRQRDPFQASFVRKGATRPSCHSGIPQQMVRREKGGIVAPIVKAAGVPSRNTRSRWLVCAGSRVGQSSLRALFL